MTNDIGWCPALLELPDPCAPAIPARSAPLLQGFVHAVRRVHHHVARHAALHRGRLAHGAHAGGLSSVHTLAPLADAACHFAAKLGALGLLLLGPQLEMARSGSPQMVPSATILPASPQDNVASRPSGEGAQRIDIQSRGREKESQSSSMLIVAPPQRAEPTPTPDDILRRYYVQRTQWVEPPTKEPFEARPQRQQASAVLPEPSTSTVLGAAFGALALLRLRRGASCRERGQGV